MAIFKLPSIDSVIGSMIAAIKRFPLTVLCALTGTVVLIYLTHNEWHTKDDNIDTVLAKILMCCELALPLFIAFALLSETRKHELTLRIGLQAIGVALVVGYYFTIGDIKEMDMVRITRYILFLATAHLFVSFAPFLRAGHLNGFWQYNKTLFLRMLLGVVYISVLYGGIALALWSIDELLHIKIGYKIYIYTWVILSCLFNTIFFLAGVPANIDELDNDTSYLKGLKVFTQYVLLPLVTLYLLILYAYIGKILIEWRLPKGLVSYLVIGYSIAGILSLLLIYPVRHNEENKWIRIFSRWYYLALFPLIIMLSISIFNRIAEYGITENRYFILVLALWLFGIATYFLMGKKENIKIIPMSLCFIAFFTSFGPWGVFSVSEHSQVNHLEDILIRNKILVNGKIDKKGDHPVKAEESEEIWSVVEYLNNTNSLNLLQPWYDDVKIDTMKYGKTSLLVDEMHLESQSNKDWKTVYIYRRSAGDYSNAYSLDIKGFETYSSFSGNYYSRERDTTDQGQDTNSLGFFRVGKDSINIYPQAGTGMYELKTGRKAIATFDLKGFLRKLDTKYDTVAESYRDLNLPAEKMSLDVETSDSLFIRFMFKTISMEKNQDKIRITQLDGDVLSKHK